MVQGLLAYMVGYGPLVKGYCPGTSSPPSGYRSYKAFLPLGKSALVYKGLIVMPSGVFHTSSAGSFPFNCFLAASLHLGSRLTPLVVEEEHNLVVEEEHNLKLDLSKVRAAAASPPGCRCISEKNASFKKLLRSKVYVGTAIFFFFFIFGFSLFTGFCSSSSSASLSMVANTSSVSSTL